MDASNVLQQTAEAINRQELIGKNKSILVAVSGGVDSMVLLHVLARLSQVNRWKLRVAHYNHQLRGKESDADARLTKQVAGKLKIPITVGKGNVRGFAKKNGVSIEMGARKLRHEFLAETAVRFGISQIAVAHHADDQIEVFFLRLLRGSGTHGLGGMNWQNPSSACPEVRMVRPFLGIFKEALVEFAAQNKIQFRQDASNDELDFKRNRIRHKLIPQLKRDYQPALTAVVLRQMEGLRAEGEYLQTATRDYFLKSNSWRDAPTALQRLHLHHQITVLKLVPDFALIEQLRLNEETTVSAKGGVLLKRDVHGTVTVLNRDKAKFNPQRLAFQMQQKSGKTRFDKVNLKWNVTELKNGISTAPKPGLNSETFDFDKVGAKVVLRHWQQGDRFQPLGFESPAKLQNLLVNRKVSVSERHELVLAATASGEIFWVQGLPPGEQFKLDKKTRYQLKWQWERV